MIKLLHGKFIIRNCLQPDRDTARLKPDNDDFVKELRRGFHGGHITEKGFNIRLEANDALRKDQVLKGAITACVELLRGLGFADVTDSGNPPSTINFRDQEVSGHVSSNGLDGFGTRLVGYVFKADGSAHDSDGSALTLSRSLVDELVNTTLLSQRYVFPVIYETLPEDRREHVAVKPTNTRGAKKGMWLRLKGLTGDSLILDTPTLTSLRMVVL